jgi:hypothetical protein
VLAARINALAHLKGKRWANKMIFKQVNLWGKMFSTCAVLRVWKVLNSGLSPERGMCRFI